MSKKTFIVILVLSLTITWLAKEIEGILNFSLGGLKSGVPLDFYQCTFISSCDINFIFLIFDIIFWFLIVWIIWIGLQKVHK